MAPPNEEVVEAANGANANAANRVLYQGRELRVAMSFHGDVKGSTSPQTFLRELEERERAFTGTQEEFVASIRSSLQGEAATWYDDLPTYLGPKIFPDGRITSWPVFKSAFQEHYGLSGKQFVPRCREIAAFQPRESYSEYFRRLPAQMKRYASAAAQQYAEDDGAGFPYANPEELNREWENKVSDLLTDATKARVLQAQKDFLEELNARYHRYFVQAICSMAIDEWGFTLIPDKALREKVRQIMTRDGKAPVVGEALNLINRCLTDKNLHPSSYKVNEVEEPPPQAPPETPQQDPPDMGALIEALRGLQRNLGRPQQNQKSQHQKSGKKKKKCNYCKKTGHEISTCWKKHGYPNHVGSTEQQSGNEER